MKKINERFKNLNKFSDIVDAMIRGLERKWVIVDMNSYGSRIGSTCFGCAATNTLCELMQESFSSDEVSCLERRVGKFNYNIDFNTLDKFERAINRLRLGEVSSCLSYLKLIEGEFSFKLPSTGEATPPKNLPLLYTSNWETELIHYKEYRDWLIQKGF